MTKVAWTRHSKTNQKMNFIPNVPHQHLQVFRMGSKKEDFDCVLHLRAVNPVVERDNTLEASRQSANKHLEKSIAGMYYFVVRVFPHHVVRENKMIAGAGADRLQKGMRQSFGRPTHKAARIHAQTDLFTVYTYKANVDTIKKAFARAQRKLSGTYRVIAE